jgi:hypothetical protein
MGEGSAMYAVVVRETGQLEAIESSGELLEANLLPRVREAPGVVSASFMSDGNGATLNVIVFETEEAARAALQLTRNAPRPGFLELESADLYRVLAHF